jgi:hypothetical protein
MSIDSTATVVSTAALIAAATACMTWETLHRHD